MNIEKWERIIDLEILMGLGTSYIVSCLGRLLGGIVL